MDSLNQDLDFGRLATRAVGRAKLAKRAAGCKKDWINIRIEEAGSREFRYVHMAFCMTDDGKGHPRYIAW